MSEAEEPLSTVVDLPFAGRRRRFQLRIGEVEELERLARAGIGEIVMRLVSHRFTSADILDTIRLGLIGGGMDAASASAAMMTLEGQPLAPYLALACAIAQACVNGVPKDDIAKKTTAEGGEPATSPPSSAPAP